MIEWFYYIELSPELGNNNHFTVQRLILRDLLLSNAFGFSTFAYEREVINHYEPDFNSNLPELNIKKLLYSCTIHISIFTIFLLI